MIQFLLFSFSLISGYVQIILWDRQTSSAQQKQDFHNSHLKGILPNVFYLCQWFSVCVGQVLCWKTVHLGGKRCLMHGWAMEYLRGLCQTWQKVKSNDTLQLLRNKLLAIICSDHLLYAWVFSKAMSQTRCAPLPHVRALPVSQPPSPGFTFCSFLQYLLAVQPAPEKVVHGDCDLHHALLPQFEKSWANFHLCGHVHFRPFQMPLNSSLEGTVSSFCLTGSSGFKLK